MWHRYKKKNNFLHQMLCVCDKWCVVRLRVFFFLCLSFRVCVIFFSFVISIGRWASFIFVNSVCFKYFDGIVDFLFLHRVVCMSGCTCLVYACFFFLSSNNAHYQFQSASKKTHIHSGENMTQCKNSSKTIIKQQQQ